MNQLALSESLTSRRVAVNTIWNLLGQGAPLLVAAVAIPVLLARLGVNRFGILSLAWMLAGYFSLFDLGLGRALTKLLAEKLALSEWADIPALVWTAITVMALLGAACATVLWLSTPFLVHHVLKVPLALQRETQLAFYPLALSIPLVTITSGLRGVLEAQHQFAMLNVVRMSMGIYTFLGPLIVLMFSKGLVAMIVALALGRVLSCFAHFQLCVSAMPELKRVEWSWTGLRCLLSFGGWITISNLIGPIMVYLDRFLIGAFISVSAVAYYSAPFEMVTKLWLIPGALVTVLFPAFSATALIYPEKMIRLYDRAVKSVFLLVFPIALALVVFAREILQLWLGIDFAQHSAIVLQWLTVGVLVNSLGYIPYALLQAAGRPDLTGKLHLVEVPCYTLALWCVIQRHSLAGAAAVWALRLAIEASILFAMSRRFLGASKVHWQRSSVLIVVALIALAIGGMAEGLLFKTTFFLITEGMFFFVAWLVALTLEDRSTLQTILRSLWPSTQSSD